MTEREENREKILALFPKPIFVEEVPNGYCPNECCKDRPWFLVATHIGHILIGWRKRVISICWDRTTVKHTADEMFPTENVTKYDRTIHAWGYEKARAYLGILLAREQ